MTQVEHRKLINKKISGMVANRLLSPKTKKELQQEITALEDQFKEKYGYRINHHWES